MSIAKVKAAPSAKEYADAFYGLEDRILRIARHAKLADYLVSSAKDRLDEKLIGSAELLTSFAAGVLTDLYEETRDLDEDYLAKHNDLVERENAALGLSS
jgi:hypothetical protein